MIDWDTITVTLDQELIDDQLYRHHFPEYMHMIKSKGVSLPKGHNLELEFVSYCNLTRGVEPYADLYHTRAYMSRYVPSDLPGIGALDLMPGYTEHYFRFTRCFEDVTCPLCKDDYLLDLLSQA